MGECVSNSTQSLTSEKYDLGGQLQATCALTQEGVVSTK